MSYKEFLYQIEAQVRIRMGKGVQICIHSVTKNNSIILDGLSILECGDNVSPAIYLNSFYQEYLAGETIEKIVNRILFYYQQGKRVRHLDTSFYTDFEKAKRHMVCRVINQEKNKNLLQEVPYRPFLNLAVVYYYLLEQEEIGSAAICIRNEHLKMWGMNKQDLDEIAVENMKKMLPYQFLSMEEMMRELMTEEEFDVEQEKISLYVLTNKQKSYGAVWITDSNVLKKIGEELGQNYYILPSSVHECMIVPYDINTEENMLLEMVKEMNITQVEPEEVLADTIYYYDRKEKNLRLIQG